MDETKRQQVEFDARQDRGTFKGLFTTKRGVDLSRVKAFLEKQGGLLLPLNPRVLLKVYRHNPFRIRRALTVQICPNRWIVAYDATLHSKALAAVLLHELRHILYPSECPQSTKLIARLIMGTNEDSSNVGLAIAADRTRQNTAEDEEVENVADLYSRALVMEANQFCIDVHCLSFKDIVRLYRVTPDLAARRLVDVMSSITCLIYYGDDYATYDAPTWFEPRMHDGDLITIAACLGETKLDLRGSQSSTSIELPSATGRSFLLHLEKFRWLPAKQQMVVALVAEKTIANTLCQGIFCG